MLQSIGAAVDHGLEQAGEHAHAVLEGVIGADALADLVEDGQLRKAHRHQHMRANDKTHRRNLGLVVLVEPDRGRAEIKRAVIEDQAARRLDLAERLRGRNAYLQQSLDELLFLRGRIQKISPDDLGRHFRANVLPLVGWPPVQFEQEPNSAYPSAGSHGMRPSCAELTHEGSDRSKPGSIRGGVIQPRGRGLLRRCHHAGVLPDGSMASRNAQRANR
ncbi:hypothetical protein ACVW04_005569 [Bradyrhizobium sp. LM2.3]